MTIYLKHWWEVSRSRPSQQSLASSHLQTLSELLLLLVDYPKAEVDLICLFKMRFHLHDLRKRFFGVFKRAITVVEYADTIP